MGSFVLQRQDRTAVPEDSAAAIGLGSAGLIRNLRWFVRLRWIIVGILAFCATVATALPGLLSDLGFVPPRIWPWAMVTGLALANICFTLCERQLGPDSTRKVAVFHMWAQIVVDLAAVTALVHFVGSTNTFIPFIYLLHIVGACIFFTPRRSFLVASLAAALYTMCVTLEHHGVWDRSTVLQSSVAQTDLHPWLPPIFAASAIVVWFGVWYLVQTLARTVVRRDLQLEKANKQLLLADEEKNKLVLRTTHDLKAPFSGIESNIQILRLQCGDELSDRAKEILSRIEGRSRSLAVRIKDILLLGRIRSEGAPLVEMETVDIAGVILEVVAELEDKAKSRGIHIEQDLLPLEILGRSRHYSILFANLISNAITYSRDDGTVTITMSNTKGDSHISIADTGIGIAEDALPHIFDEYYRSSDGVDYNPRSTGLGLSIVQEIASKEGLEIRVNSEKDNGTEFIVTIQGESCSFKGNKYTSQTESNSDRTQKEKSDA